MAEPKDENSAGGTAGAATRAALHYTFVRTAGRQEGLEHFDALLNWLEVRAKLHEEYMNDDLLNLTRNVATSVLLDAERMCEKWEQSDTRGLTY
jgi:hypothetical protein